MNEMTIEKFCNEQRACREGREWALSTGLTTMSELWQREDIRPEWREWIATRPGVLTGRELRLYACWCVRQVWHLLTDERSRKAVEVSERYADGLATDAELAEAWEAAARAAAWEAWEAACEEARGEEARSAAWAAWAAARSAAWAAWAAARSAAWAAWEAAWEAAREAAWEVARGPASGAAQSRYLLENTRPDFSAKEGGR